MRAICDCLPIHVPSSTGGKENSNGQKNEQRSCGKISGAYVHSLSRKYASVGLNSLAFVALLPVGVHRKAPAPLVCYNECLSSTSTLELMPKSSG
eukprot:scaffold8601_cov191-Amphora_coffeaeformis.AAC.2